MTSASNVYDLLDINNPRSVDEQLSLLAEMVQSFASSLDINETLTNAIEKFILYLNAEAASIFLVENDNDELVCRGCAGPVDITGLRLPAGSGIVGKTVLTRRSQIIRDVSRDPDFARSVDKDTGFVTRSILCAPLIVQDKCIGALELINKRGNDGLFNERDKNFLVALASAGALAIYNARMADQLVGQERLRKELELAREIQESLLPAAPAENFPVQGINIPAREVSGDFYDFFQRRDGLIYFNLADVSGKGMNAALLMAKVSSLLHLLAKTVSDPGELLAMVNEEVCESASHGMFVTLVSGFIDLRKKTIRLANAGHQPPLYHKGPAGFEQIQATAPPLGIMAGTVFPVTTLTLDSGSLYLFTDGVTESTDEFDHPLDVGGVIRLIEASSEVTARKRLENIVAEIRQPYTSQRDDITMMVIECRSR